MARTQILFIITIGLMCRIGTINAAVTAGYFYENPIRPFNPASFSPPLRSTGHYSFGQKVESTTQARLKVPPIPSLPPLTTYKPAQTTKYQSPYARVQPTLTAPYRTPQQQIQQGQGFQQQKLPQQQITQFQRTQQLNVQPSQQPYFYPKPQTPVSTQFTYNQQNTNNQQKSPYTIQQRNNILPQSTTRPTTTQLYSRITPKTTTATIPIQRQTQTPKSPSLTVVPQVATASVVDIPTTASVINTDSNPTQTIVATGVPEFYVVDGRQLKQYKVYENIDNDIDQEVHNFIPANFFLNSYHSMIGDTHPLGEDVQVQNRATSFQQSTQQIPRSQQLQQQQQQTPNTVALGSGGLGFVKLPNGSVYLGSGSLGYISNLQHSQDVQDLRSRTSSSGPDALHFGHGPLSDSFYYQNQKD